MILEPVKPLKINLTLEDLTSTIDRCSKEELVHSFKILLDRK